MELKVELSYATVERFEGPGESDTSCVYGGGGDGIETTMRFSDIIEEDHEGKDCHCQTYAHCPKAESYSSVDLSIPTRHDAERPSGRQAQALDCSIAGGRTAPLCADWLKGAVTREKTEQYWDSGH